MVHHRIFDVSELVSHIAEFLAPHDLTVCLRVNRLWFEWFIEPLYRSIHIFDFDYFSKDLGYGLASRTHGARHFELEDIPYCDQSEVGYGGSRVYKYSYLTKAIAAANVHSFQYLGDGCSNLTHALVIENPQDFCSDGYSACPQFQFELETWCEYFGAVTAPRTVEIWVDLITRNPSLTCVRIDLSSVQEGIEKIAEALGGLGQLKEVCVSRAVQRDAAQVLLDHCSDIDTLVWLSRRTCRQHVDIIHQPTQIIHLKFEGSYVDKWLVVYMIKRCPRLRRLTLPPYTAQSLLLTIATAIRDSDCSSTLQLLEFDGLPAPGKDQDSIVLEQVLTASDQLLEVSLKRAQRDFAAVFYLRSFGLRARLEVFSYHTRFLEVELDLTLAVLEICPNLRVFELENASVNVDRFLRIQWGCRATITRLRISISCNEIQAASFYQEVELEDPSNVVVADRRMFLQERILEKLTQLSVLEELQLRPTRLNFSVLSFPIKVDG
ncbi:hypothetical protein BGZ54_004075, partial [Gamsiella multidivaricata]